MKSRFTKEAQGKKLRSLKSTSVHRIFTSFFQMSYADTSAFHFLMSSVNFSTSHSYSVFVCYNITRYNLTSLLLLKTGAASVPLNPESVWRRQSRRTTTICHFKISPAQSQRWDRAVKLQWCVWCRKHNFLFHEKSQKPTEIVQEKWSSCYPAVRGWCVSRCGWRLTAGPVSERFTFSCKGFAGRKNKKEKVNADLSANCSAGDLVFCCSTASGCSSISQVLSCPGQSLDTHTKCS